MVERVIRTIKSRLQQYFAKNTTKRWKDVLDQFVQNYNATPHSAHKLAPQDVTHENQQEVYKRLYPHKSIRTVCRLQVEDKVLIIKEKQIFDKGYKANWSEEIYKIHEIRQSNGVCYYYISKLDGELLQGIWYYYKLNLVSRNVDQSVQEA